MATSFSQIASASRKGVVETLGAPRGGLSASAPGAIGHVDDDPALAPAPQPQDLRSTDPMAQSVGGIERATQSARVSPFEKAVQPEPSPRQYEAARAGRTPSPFGAAVQDADRAVVRTARRDINSVKTVARLVAAIARKPGSGVPNAIKSQHMASLLLACREASERIATSIAPHDAHRGWVQAAAMEAAVTLVASQWENEPESEIRPVSEQLAALEEVFKQAREDDSLAQSIDLLSQARYVEATTAEIAEERIGLSVRLAAWDLHTAVMHPMLGKGAFRFTYGRTAAQIVERLMPEIYAMAREMTIRIDSLDARTAHVQGSLRRLSDLMGAEYVTRTRAMMNWISEEGLSNEEFAQRMESARASFETRIVPDLVEWTRRNFQAVESMAAKLMEAQTHESQERPQSNQR